MFKKLRLRGLGIVILTMAFVAFVAFVTISFSGRQGGIRNKSGLNSRFLKINTKNNDNVEFFIYTDRNNNLTYAVDKHYAYIMRKYNESGYVDEYYDENRVKCQLPGGYYAISHSEKEGNLTCTAYLGKNGELILNSSGYSYCIEDLNFDGNSNSKELFYDTYGNLIETISMGCGRLVYYDQNKRGIKIFFLGKDGNIRRTASGYALIKREFNSDGLVEREFYFDENQMPVMFSLGYSGIYRKYDEFGRNDFISYLDINGAPIVTTAGYTSVRRTFYDDDSVYKEFYYDINDQPVCLSRGQYGIAHLRNGTVFLDQNGNEFFDLNTYLLEHPNVVLFLCFIIISISILGSRTINYATLILYTIFTIYMILMFRDFGPRRNQMEIFWSYKQFFWNEMLRIEIINNIILFVPIGTITYRLSGRIEVVVGIFLFSVALELIQYFTGLGLCEVDDVISNTLGGLLGTIFSIMTKCWKVGYSGTVEEKE